jgi:hypothetical protein
LHSLIALGSEYFEFWHYIAIFQLTKQGFFLFLNQIPLDAVTSDIWKDLIERVTSISMKSFLSHRYFTSPLTIESMILQKLPKVLNEFGHKNWTLLYRGTTDGFGSSRFHGKCDGQTNTLTIILTTNGFVFGGFTPIAWDSSGTWKADDSQKSFLFSVKNPSNREFDRFHLVNSMCTIFCRTQYGPAFGRNHDLYVADGCNANSNSYANIGVTYQNHTGIHGEQVLTNGPNFMVKEIEVFRIDG